MHTDPISHILQYMDSAVTPQAIAGLSGLMLARKPLVAAYATPMVQLGSSDKEAFYGVPDAAKPLLEEPSKVLELTNIVSAVLRIVAMSV
jgi:splicing factor U2AF subunit